MLCLVFSMVKRTPAVKTKIPASSPNFRLEKTRNLQGVQQQLASMGKGTGAGGGTAEARSVPLESEIELRAGSYQV